MEFSSDHRDLFPDSPEDVSRIFVNAYPDCSFLEKFLLRWRPYICPFHEIIREIPKVRSTLEVGCGYGLLTTLLAAVGKIEYGVGFDISQSAIEIACKAITPSSCDVRFTQIDKDEAWPEENFDAILCIDVMHHIERKDQRAFVKRIIDKSCGNTIIFKDCSPQPFWKMCAAFLHDLIIAREFTSYRNEHIVCNWFEEEGLTVTNCRRLDRLCYSHYLIVVQKQPEQENLLNQEITK